MHTELSNIFVLYSLILTTNKIDTMNKMMITMIAIFMACSVNAQFSNTKWKGTLDIDGGMNVVFQFKSDTLNVVNAYDNTNLETMKYEVDGKIMTIKKLYGESQCSESTLGKYKYAIEKDEMKLNLISDDCYDRSNAIATLKLKKE